MRERIGWFVIGVLCIGIIYGLFYIGYEMLPDGWTSGFKLWWSLPTFALMAAASLLSAILGATSIAIALGLTSDDDDEPEEENEF